MARALHARLRTLELHADPGRQREVHAADEGRAEIPGAQHAFELFRSLRTQYVIDGVARFCEGLRR